MLVADQPRQQVLLGIARVARGGRPPALSGRRRSRAPTSLPSAICSAVSTGSSAPRIASDQPRKGPRSACGTPSRLPMISTGMAAAKSSIRSARPFALHRVEQAVDQRDEPRLHLGDHAVRQRGLDRAAHMGVQRRIVEHEAGGVMLEQRRVAVFRAELDLLVGGEHARVAIDRVAVAPAREEIGAVRHAVHRIVLAQRAIIGKRIVDEVRRQALEVEVARGRARLLRRESSRCPRQGSCVSPAPSQGNSARACQEMLFRCAPSSATLAAGQPHGQGRHDRAEGKPTAQRRRGAAEA